VGVLADVHRGDLVHEEDLHANFILDGKDRIRVERPGLIIGPVWLRLAL